MSAADDGSEVSREPEFDKDGLRQLSIHDFPHFQLNRQFQLHFDRKKIQTDTVVSLTKVQASFAIIAAIGTIVSAVASSLYTIKYLETPPDKATATLQSGVVISDASLSQILDWDEHNRNILQGSLAKLGKALEELQRSAPDRQLANRVFRLENDVKKMKDGVPPVQPPSLSPPSVVVRFGLKQVELDKMARDVVRLAAGSAKSAHRVLCNGYSDTTGDPDKNMKLSIQRASNVALELLKDGVPGVNIMIRGYGSGPQGRTVAISIQ